MRKQLNKIIGKFGFSLEKTKKLELERTAVLENVFNKKHPNKILMSYIKGPFINKLNLEHTNLLECYTAGEIFDELGYSVDVINFWDNATDVDFTEYKAIYGLGNPITNSLTYKTGNAVKRIVYATGCGPSFVGPAGAAKVREFRDRTGKTIVTSSRNSEISLQLLALADKVIVLGNDFTQSTYEIPGIDLPFSKIPAFFYDTYDINLEKKDFAKSRKHLLWFGSRGLIHKGLDLAIDAIKEHPDLTLHICGASEIEKDFFDYYSDELNNKLPNIVNHGFIKLESDEFKNIMDTCSAVLFPSVSEGGSPALLNTIANGGLIPITTREASLDIADFGILIISRELTQISKCLAEYKALPEEKIRELSHRAKATIREQYTHIKYKETLKRYISSTLNN